MAVCSRALSSRMIRLARMAVAATQIIATGMKTARKVTTNPPCLLLPRQHQKHDRHEQPDHAEHQRGNLDPGHAEGRPGRS